MDHAHSYLLPFLWPIITFHPFPIFSYFLPHFWPTSHSHEKVCYSFSQTHWWKRESSFWNLLAKPKNGSQNVNLMLEYLQSSTIAHKKEKNNIIFYQNHVNLMRHFLKDLNRILSLYMRSWIIFERLSHTKNKFLLHRFLSLSFQCWVFPLALLWDFLALRFSSMIQVKDRCFLCWPKLIILPCLCETLCYYLRSMYTSELFTLSIHFNEFSKMVLSWIAF